MMFVSGLPQQTTHCLYTFNLNVDTAFLFTPGVSYLTMHAGSHYLPPTVPTIRHYNQPKASGISSYITTQLLCPALSASHTRSEVTCPISSGLE